MVFKANIKVLLKKSIFDPQGATIKHSLNTIGFENAEEVRVGKYLELKITAPDRATAETQAREMCEKLLYNPIIETYDLEIVDI